LGTSTNVPNIANPETSAVMFVKRISRLASMRMSTIGSSTCNSAIPHASSSTTAAAASPSVRPDVQPQFSPSVSATSIAISPPDMSVAPR
jgi:hypothetical protein